MKVKLKQYLVGLLLGLGSVMLGFTLAGIISSINFEKPRLSEFKTLPKAFIVQSGSMEPYLKTGGIVFTLPSELYKQGDVVTFQNGGKKGNLVTHRITLKIYPSGLGEPAEFTTKGDSNDSNDPGLVKTEYIVGKVFFSIPYLGYVADYAKKPHGFILFVIIPATIIVYEELKNLFRESANIVRKIKKNSPVIFKRKQEKHSYLPNVLAVIPVFGAFLVFVALSSSYFNDKEHSLDNIFTAAEEFSQPETFSETAGFAELESTIAVSPSVSPTESPSPTPTVVPEITDVVVEGV